MHDEIARRRPELAAICRRHGVTRLEVFGSAARGIDFQPGRSDADFLVTFVSAFRNDLVAFMSFEEELTALLGATVDIVDRQALEESRNFIRRRRILAEAEAVHG